MGLKKSELIVVGLVAMFILAGCAHPPRVTMLTTDTFNPTETVEIFHAPPENRPYREIAEIRVRVVPRTRPQAPLKLAEKAKEIGADAIILLGDEQVGTYMVSGHIGVAIGDAKAVAIKFKD